MLCLALACSDGESGVPRPDAGTPQTGGTSSAGGHSGSGGAAAGGGAAASSSGGTGAGTGAAPGGGGAGAGGGVGPDASAGAGGTGDAGGSGAAGGADGGTGGAPPLPYCNGHSGDLTTDGLNCGKCGNICQPSSIAYGLNAPGSVLADDKYVYWAEQIASGRIFRVPLGSANTNNPPSIASGQKNPRSLATDGTNLYWLTDDGVMKRPVAGGAATLIGAEPETEWPGDLTLDGTSIYWTTHRGDEDPYHDAVVKKMPLGGGTAVELTTLLRAPGFDSIAVDATNVYFVYREHLGSIDSQRRNSHLYKVPLTGGEPVELYSITPYTNIVDLATDAKYLYFTTFERFPAPYTHLTTSELHRMPLGGGPIEKINSDKLTPVGLAANEQGVFWVLSGIGPINGGVVGGGIWTEPNSRSEPIRLSWAMPTSINVTSTHFYVTDWLPNGTSNGHVTRFGLCVNSQCQ